ncbi:MAG: phage major capsid protein [Alphaproteobacteria bacterium]|nr:MAG: phage major capsid protein [Alphaproteobacteria bacterium]
MRKSATIRKDLKSKSLEIKAKLDALAAAADAAAKAAILDDLKGLEAQLDELQAELKTAMLAEGVDILIKEADEVAPVRTRTYVKDRPSLGTALVEEKGFKDFQKKFTDQNGRVAGAAFGHGFSGEIKGVISGSNDSAGDAVRSERLPGLVTLGDTNVNILDLFTLVPVTAGAVEWVKETGFTNNATEVAETTQANRETNIKPESDIVIDLATVSMATIAHVIPASRQIIADSGQVEALINTRGVQGVRRRMATQSLAGDGVSPRMLGVLNTPGIQTQAFSGDIITTVRKAVTKVELVDDAVANAICIHPSDWEAFDLAKDNEGQYYYGGPGRVAIPTIWGVPVVKSKYVQPGTAVLADWTWAYLLMREDVRVDVTDSHSDWFARNLIAFRFEARAGLALSRPEAFVKVQLS